jgi:hypothetical protein
MKNSRPHRFANRVGGEGGFKEECPPCKLIDVGNAKRYLKWVTVKAAFSAQQDWL